MDTQVMERGVKHNQLWISNNGKYHVTMPMCKKQHLGILLEVNGQESIMDILNILHYQGIRCKKKKPKEHSINSIIYNTINYEYQKNYLGSFKGVFYWVHRFTENKRNYQKKERKRTENQSQIPKAR